MLTAKDALQITSTENNSATEIEGVFDLIKQEANSGKTYLVMQGFVSEKLRNTLEDNKYYVKHYRGKEINGFVWRTDSPEHDIFVRISWTHANLPWVMRHIANLIFE